MPRYHFKAISFFCEEAARWCVPSHPSRAKQTSHEHEFDFVIRCYCFFWTATYNYVFELKRNERVGPRVIITPLPIVTEYECLKNLTIRS